ncbi:MAG: hypothetical protein AVDCRST_MAG49-1634 [uncultured Thermomicrobiales bacterium]|uniref:Uncharacterized protein n=1 Tax=uncultured Thermomicrobiales bacterium TaxID=1645740 RepID=A0A6J4UJQ3_9BACT|nr:MAG: hypothetical protein AVDCRST_MAG49-1634 [uncultured Thermomicrobiales bacterium]
MSPPPGARAQAAWPEPDRLGPYYREVAFGHNRRDMRDRSGTPPKRGPA